MRSALQPIDVEKTNTHARTRRRVRPIARTSHEQRLQWVWEGALLHLHVRHFHGPASASLQGQQWSYRMPFKAPTHINTLYPSFEARANRQHLHTVIHSPAHTCCRERSRRYRTPIPHLRPRPVCSTLFGEIYFVASR